ncbi:PREDICTED: ras association domain-containing protein 10 [Nanorana parkeri]|uniref:ras association domain-containing protein 10 n=1 Tax=Nanorana parkeri TaxID=125878 RepID=UPI0008548F3C|nr:PREDICTED: ras association domain-containing protein 10 [Nanorana parkeri]
MESEEEWKISVWLCQEEKLVSGLTRRTTCADVVKVLLDDHNEKEPEEGSMLLGPPHSYCIVEKWRGFERILPNKTKILRLWTAWGEEQENVRFVLVRNEASLPNIGPRSAEAKVVLSRDSQCPFRGTTKATTALTQERQRRVVKKAFRKLAKMNRKRQESFSRDSNTVEKMETLVHMVLSQDHTIRQQVQRIKDLDRDIERYEAKIHFDRMKKHGVNYVQDTYLVPDKACDSSKEDEGSADQLFVDYEDYAQKCEGVLLLQDQITQQEELIEEITAQIQEELNKRWMDRRQEELSSKEQETDSTSGDLVDCENELFLEQERVKTELSTSLYIGLRLNTDLEAMKADLEYTQEVWNEKENELQSLLQSLSAVELSDTQESSEEHSPGCSEVVERSSVDSPRVWVEKDVERCTNCEGNDEDSDTGLSSMHSQDSDSAQVCESLV